MARIAVGETGVIGLDPTLYDVSISEKSAQNLANLISKHFGWNRVKVNYTGRMTKRLRGKFFFNAKRMIINGSGESVAVILHEMAHYPDDPQSVHGPTFKRTLSEIYNLYKTELKKEMEMNGYTVEEPVNVDDVVNDTPAPKANFDDIINNVIENIMEYVECNTIHIKEIGRTLVDYKANNLNNIKTIENILATKGIKIKRG